jgi:hypothetical protein
MLNDEKNHECTAIGTWGALSALKHCHVEKGV